MVLSGACGVTVSIGAIVLVTIGAIRVAATGVCVVLVPRPVIFHNLIEITLLRKA